MSGTAQKWAWTQDLPMSQKLVLVALAWHADDDGLAWPKLKTLVNELPLSRRGIITQIRKLETSGYLIKELAFRDSGAQTTNRYSLALGGVHHTCMGGVHHDLHGGDAAIVHGGDADHAAPHDIQYKIQDKIQITCDKSQETPVKVQNVLTEHEILPREDIFIYAPRKNHKLTADGCAYIWKHCRATASPDNGIQLTINIGQRSALKRAYKRMGEDFNLAVWAVMEDWIGFTHAAANTEGAFNLPQQPVISFFVKYIETAANFMHNNSSSQDSGFVQVTAKPPKDLTKPKENKDNTHTAITSEELAAISGEFE